MYDHLKQAIQDLGSSSSFMRTPVRQAKDEARVALADFQLELLSPALREASIVLGERLEEVEVYQPALSWEPLLDAWKDVELEAGSEAWDELSSEGRRGPGHEGYARLCPPRGARAARRPVSRSIAGGHPLMMVGTAVAAWPPPPYQALQGREGTCTGDRGPFCDSGTRRRRRPAQRP